MRPEYIKCIGHEHLDLKGKSWCGRDIYYGEWAFIDPSHAAENGRQGGYMVACPDCVDAILKALRPPRRTPGSRDVP